MPPMNRLPSALVCRVSGVLVPNPTYDPKQQGRSAMIEVRRPLDWGEKMNSPSSAAMSWKSCASRSRRAFSQHDLPCVINLVALATMAARQQGGTN
jgi:hypothetical protein